MDELIYDEQGQQPKKKREKSQDDLTPAEMAQFYFEQSAGRPRHDGMEKSRMASIFIGIANLLPEGKWKKKIREWLKENT